MASYNKGWTSIGGDVNWEDYGGKWARKLRPGAYIVLDFTNMEDACGRDHNPDEKYICEVKLVDLADLAEHAPENLKNALDSCGFDTFAVDAAGEPYLEGNGMRIEGLDNVELCCVEACVGYGCYAPLDSESGGSYPDRVRGRARRFAEALIREEPCNVKSPILPSRADMIMDGRAVNKIGSTGREYMRGDLWSALRRGEGNPTVDIVRAMYGAATHTLGGEVIPDDVKS